MFKFSVLPFFLLLLPACASRAPVTAAPAAAPVAASVSPLDATPSHETAAREADPEHSFLSQSIQDNLTGLALETPAARERLEREARELAASHKHRGASAARHRHVQECMADEPQDAFEAVFCRLWLEAAGVHHPRAKHHQSLARSPGGRKRLKELMRAVTLGRVDLLTQVTESEIHEVLKKARGGELQLRPLIENALNNQSCAPAALLTALGQKTEEFFPDPDYKDLAEALYARSAECDHGVASAKGAYRLGLLLIWDQKYLEAERTLEKLTDNSAAEEVRSRVIYWRYFCAKQTGENILRDRMKEILAKEYHLTLHGLITVGPKPTDNHPSVTFRSVIRPQLNAPVRVAEALLEQGAQRDAVNALEPILDELSEAEPSFQLYVGLVLMRSGDSVHKFKILTGLYRDYPGLISHESLEMLFPLNRFEIVRHYEQKADPFLMISLIRQESAFNEHARSPVGAMGLMQLMPRTARRMERISRGSLYDPGVNIRLGVRFYSRLSERYGGEPELALAAYNAGPENVDIWQARYPVSNRMLFVDLIPFRETREYVASIARNYFWYKRLYEDQQQPIRPVGAVVPAAALRQPSTHEEKFTFFKLFDS